MSERRRSGLPSSATRFAANLSLARSTSQAFLGDHRAPPWLQIGPDPSNLSLIFAQLHKLFSTKLNIFKIQFPSYYVELKSNTIFILLLLLLLLCIYIITIYRALYILCTENGQDQRPFGCFEVPRHKGLSPLDKHLKTMKG